MSVPTATRTRLGEDGCAKCGPDAAGRPAYGRGLCDPCGRRMPARERVRYPMVRPPEATSDLVRDAVVLRMRYGPPSPALPGRERAPGGKSWAQIAAELGVSPGCLEKARQRCGWPDPHAGRPVRDPAVVNAERVAAGKASLR